MMTIDERVFLFINGLAGQSALLDELMFQFSQEEIVIVPGALLAGYWAWKNWGEAKIAVPCLLLLIGFGDLLGGQLKAFIGRLRPCQVLDHVNQIVGCGGTFSMPSNHALNSATAVSFLMAFYPSLGWGLVPVLILIGLSRVYLGAHYVTDVAGGWAIGVMLGGGVGYWLRTKTSNSNETTFENHKKQISPEQENQAAVDKDT